jgi:hypothetical protein
MSIEHPTHMDASKHNTAAHARITSESLTNTDDIAVMNYPTFNSFMNQKSRTRNDLKPQFRKGLQACVSRHAVLLPAALATAAPRDPQDDESQQCEDPEPRILSELV